MNDFEIPIYRIIERLVNNLYIRIDIGEDPWSGAIDEEIAHAVMQIKSVVLDLKGPPDLSVVQEEIVRVTDRPNIIRYTSLS